MPLVSILLSLFLLSSSFTTAQQPTLITSCGSTIDSNTEYVLNITMNGSYHSPCVVVQSVTNVIISGSIQCSSICQVPAMSLTGSSNINVVTTNITGFMFGIDITAKSPSDSYTIFNNNISVSLIAITSTGNPSLSITNNTIYAGAGGIMYDTGSSPFRGSTINISDNAIAATSSSNTFTGISVTVPSPQPAIIELNTITGQYPSFSQSDVTGIYIQNIVRGSVSNNIIQNFGVNTHPFQLIGIYIDSGCISNDVGGNKITSLSNFPNTNSAVLNGVLVAGSATNFISNSIGMLSVISSYSTGVVFNGTDATGFLVSGYGNYFDMNVIDNIKAGDANQIGGSAYGFIVSGLKTTISYSTFVELQPGMVLNTNSSASSQNGGMIGILVEGTDDIIISGNYLSSDSYDNVVFSGVNSTCQDNVNIECYPVNTCCNGCRVVPSGTVCGEVAGECQLLPTCDGVSSSCPQAIAYKPQGTQCELTSEVKHGFNPPSGICSGKSVSCYSQIYQLIAGQSFSLDMPEEVYFNFAHSYDFSTFSPSAMALLFKFSATSEEAIDYTLILRPGAEQYRVSNPFYANVLSKCPFSFPAGSVSISTTFFNDSTASLEIDYLNVTIPPNTDTILNWTAEGNNYFVYYPISTEPISFLLNGSVSSFTFTDSACNPIGSQQSAPFDFSITPTNTAPVYFRLSSTVVQSSVVIHIAQAEINPNKIKRTVVLQADIITNEPISATDSVQFVFDATATQMVSIYLSVKAPLVLNYGGSISIFSSSSYVQIVAPVDTTTTCPQQLTATNTVSFTLSQISGDEVSSPIYAAISSTVTGDTKVTDALQAQTMTAEADGTSRYYVFYPTPTSGSCAGTYYSILNGDLSGANYGVSCDNINSQFTYLPILGSFTTTIAAQTCDPIVLKIQTQSQNTRSINSVAEFSMQITNSKYIYCGDNICQMQLGEDSISCPVDCVNGQVLAPEDKWKMICGDGTCQSALGENCGTCSIDCGPTPCNVCGDGVCDPNEDCSSCYTDCGPCNDQAVQQCEQCNITNSVCGTNGQCLCRDIYSGTTCSLETIQITPIMDQQTPAAQLTIPSLPNISFEISTTALEERTNTGELVSRLVIPGLTFSLESSTGNNGSSYTTYSSQLDNGAILIISIEYYMQATAVNSIGGAINIPAQTVRTFVQVDKWPFASVTNIFGITLGSFGISDSVNLCSYSTDSTDQSGNLRWLKIARNGVTLYTQYNELAMMDGVVKNVNYKEVSGNNNEVIAVLPHFCSTSQIELRYTVINDTEISNTTAAICGVESTAPTTNDQDLNAQDHLENTYVPGSVGMSTGITIGIIAGILGVVVIGAVVAAVIIVRRNKRKSKILTRRMATVASLRTGKPHKPENTTENPLHRPATFTEVPL